MHGEKIIFHASTVNNEIAWFTIDIIGISQLFLQTCKKSFNCGTIVPHPCKHYHKPSWPGVCLGFDSYWNSNNIQIKSRTARSNVNFDEDKRPLLLFSKLCKSIIIIGGKKKTKDETSEHLTIKASTRFHQTHRRHLVEYSPKLASLKLIDQHACRSIRNRFSCFGVGCCSYTNR